MPRGSAASRRGLRGSGRAQACPARGSLVLSSQRTPLQTAAGTRSQSTNTSICFKPANPASGSGRAVFSLLSPGRGARHSGGCSAVPSPHCPSQNHLNDSFATTLDKPSGLRPFFRSPALLRAACQTREPQELATVRGPQVGPAERSSPYKL